MIDLILKDIDDLHVRENFNRLKNFLNEQVLFDGNFKLFDVTIDKKVHNFRVKHGLPFQPSDIITLSVEGNFNYYFNYQIFDKDSIYITTEGPVRIRFLGGKLRNKLGAKGQNQDNFEVVAPGDVVLPASPGFVYGAVNDKFAGFWLTSEGIPSNVVGVPVLFGDGVVIQAAVGTEVESDYEIGIFQHEGQGINLIQIGNFSISNGGPKRLLINFPIQYTSPNVQLACRLTGGNTTNLKVSLVLKGSTI